MCGARKGILKEMAQAQTKGLTFWKMDREQQVDPFPLGGEKREPIFETFCHFSSFGTIPAQRFS